ncbi:hypothetical protein COOONC_15271 [Cooperia oncophora]
MEHQKEHFRHILLFYFRKGKNASQAHKKLCAVYVDDDLIKAIIDSDRHSTTREIAEKLHVSHTCIENHLKQLGYVQKLDTKPTLTRNAHVTHSDLLRKNDEKWVVYNNIGKDRGASQVNQLKQHQKKFFANKNQKFYERGIMMLPERWQKVIDKNGQYITE